VAESPPRRSVWYAYRTLLGSRLREQTSYRTSFTLDVIGAIAISLTELIEVYVIFHNVPVFGGVRLDAALLIYGLSYLAFGLANTFAGNLDTVPQFVRTGTLDVLMLRPLPILGQMLTSEVTLKRFGQTIPALAIMTFALLRLDVAWTTASIVLLSIAPICGALIFAALFLLAGASQFWLLDGAEVTSSFTYGSSYAASFSAAVMPMPLRVFFSFVIPATFVGYLPTVTVLRLPGAAGLPTWLGYLLPVVAVLSWCVALLAWRMGLRRYVGAGG
jgi:ABC-2 type transport system permease protein